MHILLITKRQYTGKDVIDDKFGRLYELPKCLAQLGHKISVICLAYHRTQKSFREKSLNQDRVSWHLFYLWPFPPVSVLIYLYRTSRLIKQSKPDLILASSDTFHAIFGIWLARRHGIPYALDLYDQYETFSASKIPGVKRAFRHAISKAHIVICVSARLGEWVSEIRPSDRPTVILGNAVCKDKFFPRNKTECRERLNLPIENCTLIGTAGTLDASRDISLLYTAFLKIAAIHSDLHLVVAGPRNSQPPKHPRIHDLGILEHTEVALLFSALDLGIVCNANNSFSYYCCPQKLIEMQACGTPVITADIIERKKNEMDLTYKTSDQNHLAICIQRVLHSPDSYKQAALAAAPLTPTWSTQAEALAKSLGNILH